MDVDEAAVVDGTLASGRSAEEDGLLDCYPYTFSPLLLFAEASYFDKGYSNYNSVAAFFAGVLEVNMLENVLYERKNMLYEDLLHHVASQRMFVSCCIDAHFTAFQVLDERNLLYYDPLSAGLSLVSGESFNKLAGFLLLKCCYGDSQHMQENKAHYMGPDANPTRRMLYNLWRQINNLEELLRCVGSLHNVRFTPAPLDLERYLLVNGRRSPRSMSTQLTGNTCYFQTYLYALLCKVGQPALNREGAISLRAEPQLAAATVSVSRFLLEFFLDGSGVRRPLTNSIFAARPVPDMSTARPRLVPDVSIGNLLLDFYRHRSSPYFGLFTDYLRQRGVPAPDYELQYSETLRYYEEQKTLHGYARFTLSGSMPSTVNTKTLQPVTGTEGAVVKLARSSYYKYRAINFMFGFNAGILHGLASFCEFNSLRKNQLLAFYEALRPVLGGCRGGAVATSKYRDYYFLPQYEVGQEELVDLHHYTYLIDLCAMVGNANSAALVGPDGLAMVERVNRLLVEHIHFSTQKKTNYEQFLSLAELQSSKRFYAPILKTFLSAQYLSDFVGLGFAEVNPKEKDVNSLTQTAFYLSEMMGQQMYRMEHEFEKECINQMARSALRKYSQKFQGGQNLHQKYRVSIRIGHGFTYSKYNTLMHFLNAAEAYWHNPDLNNIQVFGKDIRALLAVSCQKIFFEEGHRFYHYGPIESASFRGEMDLALATTVGHVVPVVSREKPRDRNQLVLTDRVYEHGHLRALLGSVFAAANGVRFKSDNAVLNLCLLSLMLDFGLYDEHAGLLNLPWLQQLQRGDKRQLQVAVANMILEFDKKNTADAVTRTKLEQLIWEASHKFLVNKGFPTHSRQNELLGQLNCDPAYAQHLLLCKVNMSLCQINKSVEVDYYKVRCNGEFRTVIPRSFSHTTGEYLEEITRRYAFSEQEGVITYGALRLFDLRPMQPEIDLYRVRLDSATAVQSMVKCIEIKNALRAVDSERQYLVFIADNALLIDVADGGGVSIRINEIAVEMSTTFFNRAVSFVPCFKYSDSEDVILFASRNIHYLVDSGGQFATDYYGMKHELIECIKSEEVFIDLNDEHVFKSLKLSELLTESKTVLYFPDYLLQVPSRQELVNLLDLAIHVRNLSLFILVFLYLRRCSVQLDFIAKENDVVKIAGPWKEAILYTLNKAANEHYDSLFQPNFFDLNRHERLPLRDFIEVLCQNFCRYQRQTDDGQYQIVPTEKQKAFLARILCAEECFHFSEVGSGKTKVILPLLCQAFLSSNEAVHEQLARGGQCKHVLVVLVPEHLLHDARSQVFRYCLNLNFRDEYRVYDDIFALLHQDVQLGGQPAGSKFSLGGGGKFPRGPRMKQIFVTSFNQFKKALTNDAICAKVWPHREHILVVADEVDDFLDRDKLVFNICSNKPNAFDKSTLALYYEVSRAAYGAEAAPPRVGASPNPQYWRQLHDKLGALHAEIQDASRSINKSFGIFNETTLRHCSTNIAHDIEGYKSLIARPYESVNRAMPGSYYSDVERTIYLTYVILVEDIAKYDELFQQERKFLSFEYWSAHVSQIDYDDLVYGLDRLSEIVSKQPDAKDGLVRFLYEIILRRMEVRDRSRSVNSIDVIFNFDCIGFTGTPFIDNYPTFAYLRCQREDEIPDMIDRSFYAYSSEALGADLFEERFARFQGQNSHVLVEYVPSDFVAAADDELAVLEHIFAREERVRLQRAEQSAEAGCSNVLVDLCGIFKRSSIHDVRDLVLRQFGPDRFHYVYHIDQVDGSDRVLCVNSNSDVQFDEEFYKFLCKTYGEALRERIFFFVDNRNVIGKDVPFQLVYQRRFGQPLFMQSVVLAHDVDDFSKIWQAMGRSRTMNETRFSIYKSGVPEDAVAGEGAGVRDIKAQRFTQRLYERNCDCKMAGNLSSIYQTLVSLFNLSQGRFYFCDEIVNTFLEKMDGTIGGKLARHEEQLVQKVLGVQVPARVLAHILASKFRRSPVPAVAEEPLTPAVLEALLRHVVQQKFEQRLPSGDIFDEFLLLLSGEQRSLMEISYTKQQQKQKQKQRNKSQDSDTMDVFDKRHQLELCVEVDNYFAYALEARTDLPRRWLNLPLPVPILSLTCALGGERREIHVYPTLQFVYSHHIQASYITQEVKDALGSHPDPDGVCARFLAASSARRAGEAPPGPELAHAQAGASVDPAPRSPRRSNNSDAAQQLEIKVRVNHVRQSPQFTLAAISEGVYLLGMKDQFNAYDLPAHPLADRIQYVIDEVGLVLFDRGAGGASRALDSLGPYFIENYILLEVLSKQEVAQNVLEYYVYHKEKLQRSLESYSEAQGKGFICWRFLMNEAVKQARADAASARASPVPAEGG